MNQMGLNDNDNNNVVLKGHIGNNDVNDDGDDDNDDDKIDLTWQKPTYHEGCGVVERDENKNKNCSD